MADPCIFCRIIAGEIPGQFVYQDDQVVAFRDINPVAPVHVLVVPRAHIESLGTLQPNDTEIAGRLLQASAQVARLEGIDQRGFRVSANTGADADNHVAHLHLHVLGGHRLRGMG